MIEAIMLEKMIAYGINVSVWGRLIAKNKPKQQNGTRYLMTELYVTSREFRRDISTKAIEANAATHITKANIELSTMR